MTNNYLKKLTILINFGLEANINYTQEEKYKVMSSLRNSVSIAKYQDFFNELQNYLLNNDIKSEEKDLIINKIIEFISLYPSLYQHVEKLPILITKIYYIDEILNRFTILFEQIENLEITVIKGFQDITKRYLEFLNNEDNSYYIHNCYSKIEKFNNKLLDYLNRKDSNGVRNEININNPELISEFKNTVIYLETSRSR